MASQHRVRNIFGDVAEAIRAKKHIEGKLYPYDFADNINSISDGKYNFVVDAVTPPSDTTKLWIIAEAAPNDISIVDTLPAELESNTLYIVLGGAKAIDLFFIGGNPISAAPASIYFTDATGAAEQTPAALYNAISGNWELLDGASAVEYHGNYYVFGPYTEVHNDYGTSIVINS